MPRITTDLSKLYFIAIVPPSPVYEKANELKVYFSDKYHSKASLNSPPHITLHMPFQWKEKKEAELTEALDNFSKKQNPFYLKLKNFSCFSPKVIFLTDKTSLMISPALNHKNDFACQTNYIRDEMMMNHISCSRFSWNY